eukprot:Hpha_TRINITY_DN16131_c0_g1::TRINITY_DN16131_c0_g1_i1::g.4522::m.4522
MQPSRPPEDVLRDPETGLVILRGPQAGCEVPPECQILFSKPGEVPVIHFLAVVDKVSRWGKRQPRVLLVSRKVVYLTTVDSCIVTRCLRIEEIVKVLVIESPQPPYVSIAFRTDPNVQYDLLFRLPLRGAADRSPSEALAAARLEARHLVNILVVVAQHAGGGVNPSVWVEHQQRDRPPRKPSDLRLRTDKPRDYKLNHVDFTVLTHAEVDDIIARQRALSKPLPQAVSAKGPEVPPPPAIPPQPAMPGSPLGRMRPGAAQPRDLQGHPLLRPQFAQAAEPQTRERLALGPPPAPPSPDRQRSEGFKRDSATQMSPVVVNDSVAEVDVSAIAPPPRRIDTSVPPGTGGVARTEASASAPSDNGSSKQPPVVQRIHSQNLAERAPPSGGQLLTGQLHRLELPISREARATSASPERSGKEKTGGKVFDLSLLQPSEQWFQRRQHMPGSVPVATHGSFQLLPEGGPPQPPPAPPGPPPTVVLQSTSRPPSVTPPLPMSPAPAPPPAGQEARAVTTLHSSTAFVFNPPMAPRGRSSSAEGSSPGDGRVAALERDVVSLREQLRKVYEEKEREIARLRGMVDQRPAASSVDPVRGASSSTLDIGALLAPSPGITLRHQHTHHAPARPSAPPPSP